MPGLPKTKSPAPEIFSGNRASRTLGLLKGGQAASKISSNIEYI
jgi:hypothetical protein